MNDVPWFTEAQEAIEQATMTDQEKMAALTDLFGKQYEACFHMIKIPEDGSLCFVTGFHAHRCTAICELLGEPP